jgi:hypothetical protein
MLRRRIHPLTLFIVTVLAAISFLGCGVLAAEQPALSHAEKAKVIELIKHLGADEFAVRTKAAEELRKMKAGVVPVLRETAAITQDAEVKNQIKNILETLALESETDPAVLSKYGREEALAMKYAKAAAYYEEAAKLYTAAAMKETDAAKKKVLEEDAQKAKERNKRASMIVKMDMEIDDVKVVRHEAGDLFIDSPLEVFVDGINIMSNEDW